MHDANHARDRAISRPQQPLRLHRKYARGRAGTFAEQLIQISAHSTQVGVNQDYFASGENLAGIMDALRWKSPRMPLLYNRNLAAEQGEAGRLLGKLR